jgi:DNA topoisomerase-1
MCGSYLTFSFFEPSINLYILVKFKKFDYKEMFTKLKIKKMSTTNLVLVESPGKVATITKYLNNNPALKKYGKFVVVASFGHIRDLPKKNLGIDVTKDFETEYEYLNEKKEQLNKIKKAAADASVIYIASDQDQEGAWIAESLRTFLKLGENYRRIVFTEITSSALQYAIEHPGKIDNLQVASQQCRRILDRLVGFKLSPLLWKKFTSGSITLSAGRVQSAVMHLIIQREKEIEAFKSSPYWHINGDFILKIGKDITKLEEVKLYQDANVYKTENEAALKAFFKSLKNIWKVEDYTQKVTRQSPDAPFITSSLQQTASSKLRIGVKRVMAIAQELYEAGHITYMRTDSYNMSETFKESAKEYILHKYGADYVSDKVKNVKKGKGAQEAHECIRPTDVEIREIPDKYSKDHKELYKLIWQRSVAYLMSQAIYDELAINIRDTGMGLNMFFKTVFKKVKFNGYLIVYDVKNETNDFAKYTTALDKGKYDLECNEVRAKNTWQSPPARYNDVSLIKLMESNGLGRPATFSTILEKLYDKTYVIKSDIQGEEKPTLDYSFNPNKKILKEEKGKTLVGAEQGKAKPTDIGLKIDEYLMQHFDYIVDKDFTAHMEKDLDFISEGKKKRNDVLSIFWNKFGKDLTAQEGIKEAKQKVETEKRVIKFNGKDYTVRMGPYGPLVEYEKDGKKTYIGLKGYLPMAKKEYVDLDAEDIKFLMELPKKVGVVDGKDAFVVIGPYGPYIKWNGTNVKIPRFALKKFGETKSFTAEELQGFIEFSKKPKATTATAAKTTGKPAVKKKVVKK